MSQNASETQSAPPGAAPGRKSTIFIISAPSGSGKSTLVNHLMRRVSGLRFSVSFTTRAPRGQERDGEEYHFISREEFELRVSRDEFLEHAEVFGNYYGTHVSELDRAAREGFDLVLDIDVKGARQLKEKRPDDDSPLAVATATAGERARTPATL